MGRLGEIGALQACNFRHTEFIMSVRYPSREVEHAFGALGKVSTELAAKDKR